MTQKRERTRASLSAELINKISTQINEVKTQYNEGKEDIVFRTVRHNEPFHIQRIEYEDCIHTLECLLETYQELNNPNIKFFDALEQINIKIETQADMITNYYENKQSQNMEKAQLISILLLQNEFFILSIKLANKNITD